MRSSAPRFSSRCNRAFRAGPDWDCRSFIRSCMRTAGGSALCRRRTGGRNLLWSCRGWREERRGRQSKAGEEEGKDCSCENWARKRRGEGKKQRRKEVTNSEMAFEKAKRFGAMRGRCVVGPETK